MSRHPCCALLTIVLLAACNRSPAPELAKPGAAAAAPAMAPANAPSGEPMATPDSMPGHPELSMPERDTAAVDARVVAVRMSNQGDTEANTLGMPATRFGPKDTVYAEIETNGTADAYTIYTKWIGADGTVLSDYGMKVAEAGPKRTVVSLSKPDGWPGGTNSIEIAINGQAAQTVTFQVP